MIIKIFFGILKLIYYDVEIGILMATDFFNICEGDFQLGYTVIKNLTQNITTQVVKQSDDILKLTTAISLILES